MPHKNEHFYTFSGFQHPFSYFYLISGAPWGSQSPFNSISTSTFFHLSFTIGCLPLAVVLSQQLQSFPTQTCIITFKSMPTIMLTKMHVFKSIKTFSDIPPTYLYALYHITLNVFMSANIIKSLVVSIVTQLSPFSC
jgi:hypothetical protein